MTTSVPPETTYLAFIEGWNRRDADAMASCFTEDGSMIGFDGSLACGAAEVREHLAPIFLDHPTLPYVTRVDEVRQLAPQLTLLRAEVGMVPFDSTSINPAANAWQTCLLRLVDNRWVIELLQTTPAAFHGRPHLVEEMTARLQETHNATLA